MQQHSTHSSLEGAAGVFERPIPGYGSFGADHHNDRQDRGKGGHGQHDHGKTSKPPSAPVASDVCKIEHPPGKNKPSKIV